MAIFPATPSLRTRVLPRFPANVVAGTGISIVKSGGTYIFSITPITQLPVTALQDIPADRLLGRDTTGTGAVEVLTVSGGLGFTGTGSLSLTGNQFTRSLVFQSSTVTAGIKGDILVPFACTIIKCTLLGDAVVATNPFILEIWKDTYANYPPVVGDSIVASAKPTIAVGQQKGQIGGAGLVGWNVNIAADDILRFNVVAPAAATITRVAVCLDVAVT